MRVILKENKAQTIYAIKKAHCERDVSGYYIYLLLETDKIVEIEFKDEAVMEYYFSSLYNDGKINILNENYRFVV